MLISTFAVLLAGIFVYIKALFSLGIVVVSANGFIVIVKRLKSLAVRTGMIPCQQD